MSGSFNIDRDLIISSDSPSAERQVLILGLSTGQEDKKSLAAVPAPVVGMLSCLTLRDLLSRMKLGSFVGSNP
jgi:hypothetical protein